MSDKMNNPPSHYDILIVGAGPAGANLARLIDTDKFSVAVIDGSLGKEKVCGGLISPDAQNVLARYNISLPRDVLVSPQLFSVRTIDLFDGMTRYYRRNYLNADRTALDEFFRSLIPEGVSVIKSRCEGISRKNGGYELCLSGGRVITCTFLVGADGASSVVRREIFKDKRIKKYLAIQQWFDAKEINPNYSCIFDNETSTGCSWMFFKDGQMIFGGAFDKDNGREAFELQKKKLLGLRAVPSGAFDNPKKTEACLVCRPKFNKGIFCGDHLAFLVGEAAGFISPSSFEGISYALESSEALADSFNRYTEFSDVIRSYKRRTSRLALKIKIKCLKRPFMYNRILRRCVMKSGITAIKLKKEKGNEL